MVMQTGQGRRVRAYAWLPWLVLAAAWFATVQVRPLFDPDEGRYAEIPREMLQSGDWITPRFDELKYFEKPPLQYWATATLYSVAGVHEWTSRTWTVGLAFACLAAVYGWTRRLYGRDAARTALLALAASPFFLVVGHLDLLDPGFTFWLTAMVLAFTLAQTEAAHSDAERRWMMAAWAAAALAILTKGIVVLVLAGGALIIYSLIERDARPWRRLHPGAGLPLFLVLAAPWFVVVSLRNPGFARFFFVHEHFTRFLTTVHQRVEPWWYFLPLLLAGTLPWILPLARALRPAWTGAGLVNPAAGVAAAAFRPCRFLLIYALLTLVFFSLSDSKLAPYILPMFPVLAAVTGAQAAGDARFARRAAWIGAAMVAFIALGLLAYSARHNSYVPHEAWEWALAATVVAAGGLATLLPVLRQRAGAAAVVAAVSAILAWQFLLCEYGVIPPSHSARDLVAAVRASIGPQTRLYSVGQYRETISPYLGRTLTLVAYEGELKFGLEAEPGRQTATLAQFTARWDASRDAVAFFDPGMWDDWRRRRLPGRVIAADSYTVAVSRL
ncbi:MAG: glycosyltransferase family 39 protein [Steroidobacteraceae bacterium]